MGIHRQQVCLNLTLTFAAGVHADDMLIESGQAALELARQNRIKGCLQVTGDL